MDTYELAYYSLDVQRPEAVHAYLSVLKAWKPLPGLQLVQQVPDRVPLSPYQAHQPDQGHAQLHASCALDAYDASLAMSQDHLSMQQHAAEYPPGSTYRRQAMHSGGTK